jgi:hypothetical protein
MSPLKIKQSNFYERVADERGDTNDIKGTKEM